MISLERVILLDRKKLIGLRIRTMRKSRKMSQRDLARAINQSQSSITMYETGRREPDFETLEAFADIFNVPLTAIVSDEDLSFHSGIPMIINSSEAQIIASGVDKMPEERRRQALAILKAAFVEYSEYFK